MPEETQEPQGEMPENFDAWIDTQPEEVKNLYVAHLTGLKNTVAATRKERDDLKDQVKDALAKAGKGSELETSLNETLKKLESAERRATFMEEAIRLEIGCRNPKVAYALAQAENLFTRTGAPDWKSIKDIAPELFGTNAPRGNAGNGTENPPKQTDMNAIIRRAAGVQ